jgi:cyclic pyranopterin phosphate synthase
VKLYDFDGVDERLDLVPLAARRTLDRAGLRLSLDGWRSLPLELRRAITDAGAGSEVNPAPLIEAIMHALPPPEVIEPVLDPTTSEVPPAVVDGFGEARPLPFPIWSSLAPLDRYALAKVAASGKAARIAAAYRELVGDSAVSTHLAPKGGVRMVDVGEKNPTQRTAVAVSRVSMNREALGRLMASEVPKGDVLATARLAGIMAAKRTWELVPLCHPVMLTHVSVHLQVEEGSHAVIITATAEARDRTGVEMEAMVAASIAALTIYDMLKAFDKAMVIGPTELVSKSGGRSGDFKR